MDGATESYLLCVSFMCQNMVSDINLGYCKGATSHYDSYVKMLTCGVTVKYRVWTRNVKAHHFPFDVL